MPTAHLYYPDDLYERYKSLNDGEASKIFQQALRDHFGETQDIETIKKKLSLLYEQDNLVSSQINFLENKKKELEIKQNEQEQRLKELQIKDKIKKEHQFNFFKEIYFEKFGQEPALDIFEDYMLGIDKEQWKTVFQFFEILNQRGVRV